MTFWGVTAPAFVIPLLTFLPLKVANPFDPARMPGSVRPGRQEDGSLRDEWVVQFPVPHPNRPGTPIHFKANFTPPAPLFRAIGVRGMMVATEELAERVSRAGMTGIAFREIEGDRAANETSTAADERNFEADQPPLAPGLRRRYSRGLAGV